MKLPCYTLSHPCLFPPPARCKSSLRSLQMPYVRATNKFDFGCLFLATWMDALAAMCACAALARTLSACLDAMTGGLARILILGMPNSAGGDCIISFTISVAYFQAAMHLPTNRGPMYSALPSSFWSPACLCWAWR